MNLIKAISLYLFGALSTLTWVSITPMLTGHHGELNAEVREGINSAKEGNDVRSRLLFERNVEKLDDSAILFLIDNYALGKGGPVDAAKAMALIRLIECRYFGIGEHEFYLAKIAVKENPQIATEWLLRAAEVGHTEAQAILGSTEEIREFGILPDGIDTAYWADRSKVHFSSINQPN